MEPHGTNKKPVTLPGRRKPFYVDFSVLLERTAFPSFQNKVPGGFRFSFGMRTRCAIREKGVTPMVNRIRIHNRIAAYVMLAVVSFSTPLVLAATDKVFFDL